MSIEDISNKIETIIKREVNNRLGESGDVLYKNAFNDLVDALKSKHRAALSNYEHCKSDGLSTSFILSEGYLEAFNEVMESVKRYENKVKDKVS